MSAPVPLGTVHRLTDTSLVKVATCNLAQQALDFGHNQRRILESIKKAKAAGCTYRLGSELEIPGYGCEDHFYELDTKTFSWISLKEIMLATPPGIMCDVGLPVTHNGVMYNCRLFYVKADEKAKPKIVLIRPKMYLADDGNYREGRWFTGWSRDNIEKMDKFILPDEIAAVTGQTEVDFGVAIIEAKGVTVASETCEELFTPEAPNIMLGLEGVDIMSNGSASHFQSGKYQYRHQLISEAMSKNGGVYMYSNQLGCDGGRLVFDGHGMIYQNGNLLAVGEHLSFLEVEVVTAVVNLDAVRTYRSTTVSRNIQSVHKKVTVPRVYVNEIEGLEDFTFFNAVATKEGETAPIKWEGVRSHYEMEDEAPLAKYKIMSHYEEVSLAISRYLWDYLVRTANGGFFLPLSGGVDSSSTAMYVYMMCNKLVQIINDDSEDLKRKELRELIVKELFGRALSGYQYLKYKKNYIPSTESSEEGKPLTTRILMNALLHTANMPTENNSAEIRNFAEKLANALGSYHITVHINEAFIALKNLTEGVELKTQDEANLLLPTDTANSYYPGTSKKETSDMNIPRFKNSANGDWQSNLAIQNIQARLRMLTAYYSQQILPATRFNLEVLNELWTAYRKERDAITERKAREANEAAGIGPGMKPKYFPENMEFLDEIKNKTFPPELVEKYTSLLTYFKLSTKTYGELHTRLITGVRPSVPALLVLASSNADEALRGFYTKYDASSADINPIGSLDKSYLKKFMAWCAETNAIHDPSFEQVGFQFNMLEDIINVTASPELTPADKDGNIQDDEVAIRMTYDDLQILGELRKIHKLGPLGIYRKLLEIKMNAFNPHEPNSSSLISVVPDVRKFREVVCPLSIREKVFHFFNQYAMNRHKMNILTNAIHLTNYSPDDNRFDHRPFLLNSSWKKHFEVLDAEASKDQIAWAASDNGKKMLKHFTDTYPEAAGGLKVDTWVDVKSRTDIIGSVKGDIAKNTAIELKAKEAEESKATWAKIWEARKARAGAKADVIEAMHRLDDVENNLKKFKINKLDASVQLEDVTQADKELLEANVKYVMIPYEGAAAAAIAAKASETPAAKEVAARVKTEEKEKENNRKAAENVMSKEIGGRYNPKRRTTRKRGAKASYMTFRR